jgi:hypothetical protein
MRFLFFARRAPQLQIAFFTFPRRSMSRRHFVVRRGPQLQIAR